MHLLWNVQLIVALADGGAVEGVGLQDVGTRLQESRVDLLNDLNQVHSTLMRVLHNAWPRGP